MLNGLPFILFELAINNPGFRGHEDYEARDYQFEALIDDKFYFIMCPRDVVVGKPRQCDSKKTSI